MLSAREEVLEAIRETTIRYRTILMMVSPTGVSSDMIQACNIISKLASTLLDLPKEPFWKRLMPQVKVIERLNKVNIE